MCLFALFMPQHNTRSTTSNGMFLFVWTPFHMWLLLFFLLINNSNECSNSGQYFFEKYLGSRTPYRLVSNKSFDKIHYEGCTPAKIWMIVRHGTRNPSGNHIELMRERLPEIRDALLKNVTSTNEFIRNRDLDQFRRWKTKLDTSDGKKLVHEGEEEMVVLAERMQSRFPTLFDTAYSNTSYQFKYTHSQRTHKSALYFASGLFGKKTVKDVWFPVPSKKDPILRFYKNCNKWINEIKQNPGALKEAIAFEKSKVMKKTVEEVSSRIGVNLSTGDVVAIHFTCSFETAFNKLSKSPWCSIFSEDNLKVLEYADDLKYYWLDGYGYELTYAQACPAFGNMINFLESQDNFPKTTIYFSHSGTILKLLAHVGLYKDVDCLTSENFDKLKEKRKWRTGLIDSFGSNIAFVLFNCDDDINKVLTLHQENVVRLPSCPDSDLCDISKINQYYTQSINSCNFDAMCKDNFRN